MIFKFAIFFPCPLLNGMLRIVLKSVDSYVIIYLILVVSHSLHTQADLFQDEKKEE